MQKELIALRSAYATLNLQKFSQYPTLRTVCGGNDLADDFLVFERKLERIIAESNRDKAAAALSIASPHDLLLHRLEAVVEHFDDDTGEARDQSTARRWSDRDIPNVATELVHLARLHGWLGRENLAFELSGNREGLQLSVWYYFSEDLNGQTPVVSIWNISGSDVSDESIEVEHDLANFKTLTVDHRALRLEQYKVDIALPDSLALPDTGDENGGIIISIDTVDAPMRTIAFTDDRELGVVPTDVVNSCS